MVILKSLLPFSAQISTLNSRALKTCRQRTSAAHTADAVYSSVHSERDALIPDQANQGFVSLIAFS
ncbi:MAG: hypothetical protein KAR05_11330 [Candidatus Omnitrophica bacterium]|nr:hypothetical protein [Candidatus Omnitrophota bacterium]